MAVSTQCLSLPSLNAAAPLADHPVVSEPPLEACLLLAQAVAQYGTRDWDQIAQRLDASEHWPVEAGKMTSQGYAGAFDEIMRERGLDPQQCQDPLAAPARKLVHMLYSTLLSSLRQSILTSFQEEARLQEEIEAIRAGQRDEELAKEVQAMEPSADMAADVASPTPKEAEAESGPETTPKKGGRKGATAARSGSRAAGGRSRRTPAGATAGDAEVESGAADIVEESVEPETGSAAIVKAEDHGDDDEAEPSRAATVDTTEDVMQVDDAGTADGREGDGDTAEGEEQTEGEDEVKPKRSRGRKGRASTAPKSKKRKQSEPPATSPPPPAAGDDGSRKRKRVKTTEEPADADDKDTKAAVQRRKVAFTRIIEQLQAERYSHYFESRVTRSIAPMYNVAVRRPTCLKDVLKAIKSGAISNTTELMRDVALLCANAIQFNGDEGEESVGYCAKLLWERFERLVDETLSTLLAADEA